MDSVWGGYESRFAVALDGLISGSLDAAIWLRVLVPFVAGVLVRGPDFNHRFTRRTQGFQFTPDKDNINSVRLLELQRLLAPVLAARWQVFKTNGSESHEAVTATSRELMLQAKEVAEDMGFTVLHMYVDCLFVQQACFERASDFPPLLDAILTQTGIPIALEGVYKWLAFLSSKRDARVPVPNQYFGAFEDGTLKFRGIELRRRDTTLWVRKIQLVVLEILAKADTAQELAECLPDVLNLVARAKRDLKGGRVHLEELVVTQKLSRELDGYKSLSPAARAALQLQAAGHAVAPGQAMRFLFTRGCPGVQAWELGEALDPRET